MAQDHGREKLHRGEGHGEAGGGEAAEEAANAAFWKGRSCLVTGAGGFIGSHLIEALVRAGARVRAMAHYNSRNDWGLIELLPKEVRESLQVICGDIRDPFFCREAVEEQEVVFHLAALIGIPYSYAAPADYVQTNISGTVNVLQACRRAATPKIVHTSTSETYGTAQYVPIDEKHPLQGQSPYSASKIGADKIAESYYLSFQMPVATIRPFNTYGPRQSARAVIPTIMSQLISGSDVVRLGALDPVRDLNFVEDTAAAFMAVASCPRTVGEVLNVGSGLGISIRDLAQLIMEIMGRHVPLVQDEGRVRPEGSEVQRLIAAAERIRELTSWRPRVDLREGLERTAVYIRNNLERYKPEIYNV